MVSAESQQSHSNSSTVAAAVSFPPKFKNVPKGSRRLQSLAVTFIMILWGFVIVIASPTVAANPVTGTGGMFVAAQGRVLDTRSGIGGYTTPMTPGLWRSVQIGGVAGVPASGAGAVQITLSALPNNTTGSASVSADLPLLKPQVVVDYAATSRSNTAIVPLASSGQIMVKATTAADIVVDVQGYYTETTEPGTGGFVPLTPTRVATTVTGLRVPVGKLASGTTTTIQVSGVGGIPVDANAVFVNAAIGNSGNTSGGWFTLFPAGSTRPPTGSDYQKDAITSFGMIVALSSTGSISIYNQGQAVDLWLDVDGYFDGSTESGVFTPATAQIAGNLSIPSGAKKVVAVAGAAGLPPAGSAISAAALSLTAKSSGSDPGYVTIWPSGLRPNTSALNLPASTASFTGFDTSGLAADGTLQIFNSGPDAITLSILVQGWYGDQDYGCVGHKISVLAPGSAGADQGRPVVSAMLVDTDNAPIDGEIFIQDDNGNPVGSSPTAVGTIDSGTRLTYAVPPGVLADNETYSWWVEGTVADACAASVTSQHWTFSTTAPPSGPPATTDQLTISGPDLQVASAPDDPTGCAGAACPLQDGVLELGNDGAHTWIARLKADLSSIPAGAAIESAMLTLPVQSCSSSPSCGTGEIDIDPSEQDVAASGTGADLAAAALDAGVTVSESTASVSADITSLVQGWTAQGATTDLGAVLEDSTASGPAPAVIFASPSAGLAGAKIDIDYAPPGLPSTPPAVHVTAGDGGLIASWSEPVDTGYFDGTGATDGISQYRVDVKDSSGTVVATRTTSAMNQVINGLTNGTAYRVSVTAINPIGAGAASTSAAATPHAATAPSSFVDAAAQTQQAENGLESGQIGYLNDALSNDSQGDTIAGYMGTVSGDYTAIASTMAEVGQTLTGDSSTLSNTLVSSNTVDGSVTVYATVDESFTTIDTSTGTEVDVPGSETQDLAYLYTADPAGTIALTETVNADELLEPVSLKTVSSTYSTALEGPPPTSMVASTIDPDTGLLTTSADTAGPDGVYPPPPHFKTANLKGVTSWANANYKGGDSGFDNDCTDFVSRALLFGGHLQFQKDPDTYLTYRQFKDPINWFDSKNGGEYGGSGRMSTWTASWSFASYNYQFAVDNAAKFYSTTHTLLNGEIIWIDENPRQDGGSPDDIDHAGVVTHVVGNNFWVTQHSKDESVPFYKLLKRYWREGIRHIKIWRAHVYQAQQNFI